MTASAKSRYTVNVERDAVVIRHDKDEVLYWDANEMVENPQLIFQVVHAIKIAYENPEYMDRIVRCVVIEEEHEDSSN